MTFSYDAPTLGSKDEIRFLIGDTEQGTAKLSDEEIAYVILRYPGNNSDPNYIAAAVAAISIAARYASLVSKTVGGLSLSYEEQNRKYIELSDKLRGLALFGPDGKTPMNVGIPELFGGGISILGPDLTPNSYSS